MSKPIPPLDLMWLIMETPASPTHVGALLLFEKPRDRPDVVREIVAGLPRPANLRPRSITCRNSAAPACRTSARSDVFDPHYHVQHIALPHGATYDDLLRLVADLHEPTLDRARPLFRDWFIDGVPDNLFAVYAKAHHAIVDGVSGTKRLYASLSTSPRHSIPVPAFAAEMPVQKPRPPRALVERLAELGMTATRQTLALRDVSVAALKKGLVDAVRRRPGRQHAVLGAARADERAAADGALGRDAVAAARRDARRRQGVRRRP